MRVISGKRKGQRLKIKAGGKIRPTTGMVRGAVFNILGQNFSDFTVLDLFAGTGAMGIEALSRGARLAVFVDSGRDAVRFIRESLEAMNLCEEGRIMAKKAAPALKLLAAEGLRFDLVFIDPPYQSQEVNRVMETLAQLDLLEPEAQVVVEHDPTLPPAGQYGTLIAIDRRTYGKSAVSFYQRREEQP